MNQRRSGSLRATHRRPSIGSDTHAMCSAGLIMTKGLVGEWR